MTKTEKPQLGQITERSDGRKFITGSKASCHPKSEVYIGTKENGEEYYVCGECDLACDLDKSSAKPLEEPAAALKPQTASQISEKLQSTIQLLVYGLDFSSVQVQEFVDKMGYFIEETRSIADINAVLPDDCGVIISADKAIKAYFKEPLPLDPYALADKQKVFLGWKHAIGELEAKYSAMAMGKEFEYYGTRGASFVALTKFGHSLERNIKEGKTVADRENQAQLLTIPVAKERVYYTWVSKRISNVQWSLMGIISNIDQALIEARRERKAAEQPTR